MRNVQSITFERGSFDWIRISMTNLAYSKSEMHFHNIAFSVAHAKTEGELIC